MRQSLTAIANKYGTDKGTEGPMAEWRGHNYTDIYEAYLWPMRDRPIRLLEVGLGVVGGAWPVTIAQGRNACGGGSVKMWTEYFPRAEVFGIDINPAPHLDTERITTIVADQGDAAQLRAVGQNHGPFDVIIDDGSHRAEHQQITFAALFPYLRDGGLYFIEDLLDNGTEILSTSRVFATFAATAELGMPNTIGDLAADIEWGHFHASAVETMLTLQRSLRHPVGAVLRFGSPKMVVLRRASPQPPIAKIPASDGAEQVAT